MLLCNRPASNAEKALPAVLLWKLARFLPGSTRTVLAPSPFGEIYRFVMPLRITLQALSSTKREQRKKSSKIASKHY